LTTWCAVVALFAASRADGWRLVGRGVSWRARADGLGGSMLRRGIVLLAVAVACTGCSHGEWTHRLRETDESNHRRTRCEPRTLNRPANRATALAPGSGGFVVDAIAWVHVARRCPGRATARRGHDVVVLCLVGGRARVARWSVRLLGEAHSPPGVGATRASPDRICRRAVTLVPGAVSSGARPA
jgi:hypothetical protein